MKPTKFTKKILLIHAPFKNLNFGQKWEKSNSLTPPLGLMYLAAPLIKNGFQVDFIDFNVDKHTLREFIKYVKNTYFIGISCYSETLANVIKLIKLIRKFNPHTYIICGGPHCNLTEDYVQGADLVAIGEAETYIVEILKRVISGQSLKNIPGLIYKKQGRMVRTGGIMQFPNLDKSDHTSHIFSQNRDYGHFFDLKINNLSGTIATAKQKRAFCFPKFDN